MNFNAESLTYPDACALMDRLRFEGIECAVTVGGVRVYPSEVQASAAKQICRDAGAYITTGLTLAQELSINPLVLDGPEEKGDA